MRGLFNVKQWFRKPNSLLVENKERFDDFTQSKPLSEYTFVVFDTELTGLNKRQDEIISIGAVKICNLHIDLHETFHQYVRPQNLEHTESTLVHRITPEQLRAMPSMGEVLPEFIRFCSDALLVGHYVALDVSFINKSCREVLGGTISNPSIDTMRMAKGYKEAQFMETHGHGNVTTSYNLGDLSQEFGLPQFKAHDALEDALQTAYLFLYLVKKLKQGRIRTLKDLYEAGRNVNLIY